MADPKIRYDILANAEGEEDVRRLAAELEKFDEAIDPAAAQRAKQLSEELVQLGEKRALIQQFFRALTDANEASRALENAQGAADRLARRLESMQQPTQKQAGQLEKLRDAAAKAQTAYTDKTAALNTARGAVERLGISTANLSGAEERLTGALQQARQQAQQLAVGYERTATAAKTSAAQQVSASQSVDAGLQGIASRLDGLRNIGIGTILGGQTAQLLRGVTETADAFANLSARIKLVTGDGPPLQQALTAIEQIALRTGSSLESTGTLFARVATAGRELNLSQADSLKLTELINRGVQLSGSSAQASEAAIQQLIQGIQSGVLRGQEFNSVNEQSTRVAQALADGLGVTRAELRGLANDGKLGSQVVLQALLSQSDVLEREFAQLPATVGRALENLQTKWLTFIGSLNNSTGATATVASGINAIADNLDELAGIAGRAGSVLVAALAIQGVNALRALAVQAVASGGAMAALSADIAKVPRLVNITVAVVGLEVGFQIGELLRENSELARKLGVGVTEFFVALVNDLQFVKEAAAAIFTDDTIGASFDRFKQRAEEQRAIFADLYREAEQSPEVVRAAAASAAAELGNVGTAATKAGAVVSTAGATGAAGVASVGTAANTAASAIAELGKAASVTLPGVGSTAREQALALAELAGKSADAAATIGQALPAALSKLSGAELENFRTEFVGALGQAADKAQLLQQVLLETGKRAAQALGVDVAQASSTLSAGFVEAQDNLALVIRSLDTLRANGVDTALLVQDALAKMIDGAKNQREFDALRGRILALGEAGLIAKPEVEALLDSLRRKADDATKGVNSLSEAYRLFGITTKAELQKTAENSSQAWEFIRNDATASLDVQRQAFTRYAEAAIAANDGVATSTIRAQAQALALALEFDNTGKVIVRAMAESSSAVDATARRVAQLQDRYKTILQGYRNGGTSGSDPGSQPRDGGPFPSFGAGPTAPTGAPVDPYGRTPAEVARLQQQGGPVDNSFAFQVRDRVLAGDTFTPDELAALQNGLRVAQQNARLISGASIPASFAAVRDAESFVNFFQRAVESALVGSNPVGGGFAGPYLSGGGGNNPVVGAPAPGPAGASASAPAPGPTPPAPTATYIVNVNIGGQTRPFTFTDQSTADGFVQALEDSYRAGGGG